MPDISFGSVRASDAFSEFTFIVIRIILAEDKSSCVEINLIIIRTETEIGCGKKTRHVCIVKKEIIALLPGSRKQEVSRMLEIMLKVVDRFPNYQFVIACAPSLTEKI